MAPPEPPTTVSVRKASARPYDDHHQKNSGWSAVVYEVRRDAAKPSRRPVDFMLEAKLRPPLARPEWVTRSRLGR